MFLCPDHMRVTTGPRRSTAADRNNGAFVVPLDDRLVAFVIASDGDGWEHVSVTLCEPCGVKIDRCPTWDEMVAVKRVFWSDDDAVMQLHPRQCDAVNVHPYCLHLWRPALQPIPLPPKWMV